MQLGHPVILTSPYKGHPAGTPLIFLQEGRDSGYRVALCLVCDASLDDWLQQQGVADFQTYLSACRSKRDMSDESVCRCLDYEHSVLKPLFVDVCSVLSMEESIQKARQSLTELEAMKSTYLRMLAGVSKSTPGAEPS